MFDLIPFIVDHHTLALLTLELANPIALICIGKGRRDQ